jgi:predicted nucleotidyltransferase
MKTLEDIRRVLREYWPVLVERYGVQELAIFGSYARGEAQPGSDLDLLVEFAEPLGLFRFIQLERELSELLGVKVELVTRSALKPHIGRRVLQEAISV